jgi:hypothetical protein
MAGTIPDMAGTIPAMAGTIPAMAGTIPAMAGMGVFSPATTIKPAVRAKLTFQAAEEWGGAPTRRGLSIPCLAGSYRYYQIPSLVFRYSLFTVHY